MNDELLKQIVEEVRKKLIGRFLGKIFQLTSHSYVVDFGGKDTLLFISAEPSSPRFYLVQRRIRDLEKQSTQLTHFGLTLKAKLNGGELTSIEKDLGERVVRLTFRVEDETGLTIFRRLVAQLTGKASNLFVIDELDRVTAALRNPKGPNQTPGELYRPPVSRSGSRIREPGLQIIGSASASADEHFTALDQAKAFEILASSVRSRVNKSITKQQKLKAHLLQDLNQHGEPEKHKQLGDLLLANIGTAVRKGNLVSITDYYADGAPTMELEIDENTTLQDAANAEFRQYTKAKRAREEISQRLDRLERELSQLEQRAREIEAAVEQHDEAALKALSDGSPKPQLQKAAQKESPRIPGVRHYQSTDGYEILVGRAARDNDHLTFKIARPHDMWMHAGDYPGSHVVVRNSQRKEIPQRTIIEAAQLAARFSQASEDSKVVVHYTERKFLSKPKGSAPGLVRMSSFRSITVEPKEGVERVK
jgi:predicted ribosome quality control (RQC) complex YloA/Tae2 family protein